MDAHAAAGLLLLVAGTATAGPIPAWSFRNPANEISFAPGATGGISFPNTPYMPGPGGDPFRVTAVVSSSLAPAAAPDRATDLAYQFAVELRDDLSGEVAALSFGGTLTGTFWTTGADVANRFTGPTSRTAELGGTAYTLSLLGFDPPGGSGDVLAGGITARVTVGHAPLADPVGTPEPATVLLALIGLPFALVRTARGRRRATARNATLAEV